MKSRRILLEADNLTLANGTGIATYAKNLALSLGALGYQPDALIGVPRPLATKDAVLNQMGFYDPNAERRLPWQLNFTMTLSDWFGSPFGVGAGKLLRTAAVIDPQPGRFDAFANVRTVFKLAHRARDHFKRHGSSMRINLDDKPDLFHATQAIPIKLAGMPNLYTIHDLIPLKMPYSTLDEKKYSLEMHRALAKSADHIVTVSEHSKRDIVEMLGVSEDRITNTYQAVSMPAHLVNRPMDEVANELDSLYNLEPDDYFLFVGAIEPKKNVGRLVDAFASSGSRRRLIIAGSPAWMADDDLRKIDDERFFHYEMRGRQITPRRSVRRLSYVPFDQLVSLIRGARALIFPSLYEGFGLPVLEAMLLGTPVITSNVSSLPEIAGDAALLVSPRDTAELTLAIRRLDADDALAADLSRRGRQRAAQFTVDAYRDRLNALYRRILGA